MDNNTKFVTHIPEPPLARFVFADTRIAWLWLLVRLYVGWVWLEAGWEKLHNPAWVGGNAGAALTGFLKGALAKSSGMHPDVQGWYAGLIQNVALPHAQFISYMVVSLEILLGVLLIAGLFTGIAAFVGSFMNMNFLLAGTVSVNPILLFLQLLLIFAWRVAGWYGLDRKVLPELGTPWREGKIFK